MSLQRTFSRAILPLVLYSCVADSNIGEITDLQPDVDDTDGIDAEAEFDSWRARELARLLRDKQAKAAVDEERAEIERRRAMPEEQRLAEDLAHAEETRNREKGEMGFLQKYYHKGAFHGVSGCTRRGYWSFLLSSKGRS